MRIMITGGGTGGHTSPALAVIQELQKRDPRLAIQWVGRAGGIEQHICEKMSIPFRGVPVEGWPRKRSIKKAWVALKLGLAVARCMLLIHVFRPQLVFGVGGYVSLPLMLAAQRRGIPTVIHEQNRLMGMANRMLSKRAARILLSFPDTVGDFPRNRVVLVGNPVRAEFCQPPDKESARKKLDLDPNIPVVLVCGGSQGAHSINQAVAEALGAFSPEDLQFIWMTGHADVAEARQAAAGSPMRAYVFPFIEDMATACAAADVIVSRSGASTTAEIACMGKPSVLIPYPHATDNHQEQNAKAFQNAGAAVMLRDQDCTGQTIASVLRDLLTNQSRLEEMRQATKSLARPNAGEAIVEEVFSLIFEQPRG